MRTTELDGLSPDRVSAPDRYLASHRHLLRQTHCSAGKFSSKVSQNSLAILMPRIPVAIATPSEGGSGAEISGLVKPGTIFRC